MRSAARSTTLSTRADTAAEHDDVLDDEGHEVLMNLIDLRTDLMDELGMFDEVDEGT